MWAHSSLSLHSQPHLTQNTVHKTSTNCLQTSDVSGSLLNIQNCLKKKRQGNTACKYILGVRLLTTDLPCICKWTASELSITMSILFTCSVFKRSFIITHQTLPRHMIGHNIHVLTLPSPCAARLHGKRPCGVTHKPSFIATTETTQSIRTAQSYARGKAGHSLASSRD